MNSPFVLPHAIERMAHKVRGYSVILWAELGFITVTVLISALVITITILTARAIVHYS